MKKIKVFKTDDNFISSLLSEMLHLEKDTLILYSITKFWDEIGEKTYSADITKSSKCVDFKNGRLYIKTENGSVRSEVFIKKDEVREVINLYLRSKMNSNENFVKKIVVM